MNPYAPNSPGWLTVDLWGMVSIARIVAVGMTSSAPIRRLLNATPPAKVLILTGGQRRKTVLVLDSGHVVITPLTLQEIANALNIVS